MTNWYSTSIKADLADLLARNPDPLDILDFIRGHAEVEELVTREDLDTYMEEVLSLPNKNDLPLVQLISKSYDPEDIFTDSELGEWAELNQFVDADKVLALCRAVHGIDDLLSADSSFLEHWQKEIDKVYDALDDIKLPYIKASSERRSLR